MKPMEEFAQMVIEMFNKFTKIVKERDKWTDVKRRKVYCWYRELCKKFELEPEYENIFILNNWSPIQLYSHIALLWFKTHCPRWQEEAEDLTIFNIRLVERGRIITFWCPHKELLRLLTCQMIESGHDCAVKPWIYKEPNQSIIIS